MRNKILVTGASGFIGFNLCCGLLKEGYKVLGTSLKRDERIKILLKEDGFSFKEANILDYRSIDPLFQKNNIKAVFHLAAVLPFKDSDPLFVADVNSKGTLNILKAAEGIEKFVYASTMSVYSDPPGYLPVDENHPTFPSTIYGASKMSGELYCDSFSKKMKVVVLRYGGAYGSGQHAHSAVARFIEQAKRGEDITIYGKGTQTTDFIDVEDIVSGSLLALKKGIGAYNIGSGEETSIKELANKIIKMTGSDSKIILEKETDRPFRFYLDIKKAKKELGFNPKTLEEGLVKYL